nr:hypothetical protein [Escherichia coli]
MHTIMPSSMILTPRRFDIFEFLIYPLWFCFFRLLFGFDMVEQETIHQHPTISISGQQ